MFIDQDTADQFVNTYKALLLNVFESEKLQNTNDLVKKLVAARECIKSDPEAANRAFEALEAENFEIQPNIKQCIQNIRIQQWVYLRSTTRYAIFIDDENSQAYAVKALNTPIEKIARGGAAFFEAGLIELNGHYVCDGLILMKAALGPGFRSSYSDRFAMMKKDKLFHMKPTN